MNEYRRMALRLLDENYGIPLLRDNLIHEDILLYDAMEYLAGKLEIYRKAWVEHPQFEHLRQFSELDYLKFDDPTWIPVVHVYKHPPGINKHRYSYQVAEIDSLEAVRWALKRPNHTHHAIRPMAEPFWYDPININVWSLSYDGKARGYYCRMNLKALLPSHLKKWVGKIRRMNSYPKYSYLRRDWEQFNYYMPRTDTGVPDGAAVDALIWGDRSNHPDWYKSHKKRDLWKLELNIEHPEIAAEMRYWMGDEINFYRAATGKMHPEDVKDLFIRFPAINNRHEAAKDKTIPMFEEEL